MSTNDNAVAAAAGAARPSLAHEALIDDIYTKTTLAVRSGTLDPGNAVSVIAHVMQLVEAARVGDGDAKEHILVAVITKLRTHYFPVNSPIAALLADERSVRAIAQALIAAYKHRMHLGRTARSWFATCCGRSTS